MKSKLLKTGVLAAAAFAAAAFASPLMAKTMNFAFTGYCDGISLTQNGVTFAGARTGCVTDSAGGIEIKIPGGATKYADVSTTDSGVLPVYTFLLDVPGLHWWVYDVSGGQFTLVNSGTMTRGKPAAQAPGAHQLKSTDKSARPGHGVL
jgi:hypothetical protein